MEKFIEMFNDVLEIEDIDINSETVFKDLEEWDSLAVLSVLAMINEEYDITIPRDKFKKVNTIGELFSLTQE